MSNDIVPQHTRSLAAAGRTDGVLIPRAAAYVVDVILIAVLAWVASIGIGILGVLTFGYGWMLWSVVWILTAMAYAALTIGGRAQATPGMRACGLIVETPGGARPDGIAAAAHCLLFYVATFTIGLLLVNVLIGFLRADGRMGHDLLTGLIVLRK